MSSDQPRNTLTPTKIPPLNLAEVAQIAISLQSLVGAQLQDCVQTASELGLAFYHDREMLWLWFDFHPQRPLVVRIEQKPPTRKKIARPLTLFLRSRFFGRRLKAIRADLERGRILIFEFHRSSSEESQNSIELEIRLIPHAFNAIAKDGPASIAEEKPKDLPPSPLVDLGELEVRNWEEIEAAWWALQNAKTTTAIGAPSDAAKIEAKWKKAVEKKETALVRMSEELAHKTSGLHRALGDWLKTGPDLSDIPDQWREFVDTEKSLSWNIEQAFHRAKENERKAQGTRDRIALVTKELNELKKSGPRNFDPDDREKKANASLLNRADAKGRRHSLGDLELYIGKSAADNMALLRRAQPFDLWLHLRDYPGSHVILRRSRGRVVTDVELREASVWAIEQSLGKRARELAGQRFDVLIVECRYVRPIKGDKLGRVNYSNDRVLTVRL